MAWWIRLSAPSAGDPGSIPGQGTRSHMHAATKTCNQKQKQKQKGAVGTSLVAQWLRTCLPMQGTQVRALVQEDPTTTPHASEQLCPCTTTTEPAL